MSRVNPITLLFVVVAAAGFALMAKYGYTPAQMAATAAAVVAAGSQLEKLIATKPTDPPAPPPVGPVLILLVCIGGLSFVSCATLEAQKAEAETAYLGEQLRCVDKAKSRDEADACRKGVRERWGITETVAKDGGRE